MARDGDLKPEIKKRTALGWAAFRNLDNVIRNGKSGMKIKRKVLSEHVTSVTTYGSETRALTTTQINALILAQRKLE